jgi:uncharacterized protein
MLFAVINTDRPAALDLRMSTRPAHIAFLEGHAGQLVHGGAILDGEGKPCGSLLIVEADSADEVRALMAQDPYAEAGLFESALIRPFREVFRDGRKVA